MHEALFYSREPENRTRCHLCPHNCLIYKDKAGICRVRFNQDGKLYTGVFGRLAALHCDPVEKKPLYHFYPGSQILSVGTPGCNLHCSFCQNFQLSQFERYDSPGHLKISPEELVRKASGIPGNIGLAYTYNEPTVFYEMMLETARLAKLSGLKNVAVSNGFINQEPLSALLEVMDAFNIDLKAFNDDFYRRITGGKLQPVLDTMKSIYQSGRHLEITLLVIPGLNDSADEFNEMLEWINGELSPDIPLHLSRYFPSWKMDRPPTPEETLLKFADLARSKLRFVYIGNVINQSYSSTRCPDCQHLLINRSGYSSSVNGLTTDKKCSACGRNIPMVM
jgi:pyruvate formate lyase activating enzyme